MVNGKAKMCHASKMKRDPASNKRFEVYEDDVYDTLLGDDELEIEDLEYMRRMNDLEYPTEDGLPDTHILPIDVENEIENNLEALGDTELDHLNGNDNIEVDLTNLERPDIETVEGYDDIFDDNENENETPGVIEESINIETEEIDIEGSVEIVSNNNEDVSNDDEQIRSFSDSENSEEENMWKNMLS